jgi:2-oxoglutarate/2-oxoacid ferredoxin oxidoreductase subunit alpha
MQPLENTFPDWAVSGAKGRERASSAPFTSTRRRRETNLRLLRRWQEVEANEVRYKEYFMEDAVTWWSVLAPPGGWRFLRCAPPR